MSADKPAQPFAWFVWARGTLGPIPEKWSAYPLSSYTAPADIERTIAKRPITEREWADLSCRQLAAKYPLPALPPNTEQTP